MKITKNNLLEILKSHDKYVPGMSKWKRQNLLDTASKLKLVTVDADPDPPPCDNESIWIPLRNKDEKIIDWALIDLDDYEKVSKYKWHVTDKIRYAKNGDNIQMHTLILGKPPPGMVIDHKNNKTLDNRKKNLRFVTWANNSQNKAKRKGSSSQYFGVTSTKWGWCVQSGRSNLGYFKDETHAAYCYDEHIREKFGNGGKVNGIEKPENYQKYVQKPKSDLPKGVRREGKKYKAICWIKSLKKEVHLGMYLTREEARNKYLAYHDSLKRQENAVWELQPILKNNENIAIIPVKNKDKTIYTLVDDDMWHELIKTKWRLDTNGYVTALRRRMHSVVLNAEPDQVIDHIYSKLDNRKKSLRANTYGGNSHHRKSRAKSGYKGVSIANQKWRAKINYNRIEYRLGSYTAPEIAAYAYDQAALQLYKEVASINGVKKPDGWEWDQTTFRLISTANEK